MKKIRKAVFPVAGLGTRFLPATKATPKEMLPIVDKPLIQFAVEEAIEAGITEMIFVTGRTKRAIEDHFDKAYELEAELAAKNKTALLKMLADVLPSNINCIYIRQSQPLGLGHAVGCAASVVDDEPFAVILADDLIDGQPGALKQMIEAAHRHGGSVLGVEDVPREKSRQYGIVSFDPDRRAHREGHRDRRKAGARGRAFHPGGGRPLRADAAPVRADRNGHPRGGRRDPAHRRHQRAAGARAGVRLPLCRHPL